MSLTQRNKDKVTVSKFYYLREKRRSASEGKIPKMQPLAVHLSSLFQKDKRNQLNKQMKFLAKKLDSCPPSDVFQLTARPQSTAQIRNTKMPTFKRQIHTSYDGYRSTSKKKDQDAFFISDIFNETWSGRDAKKEFEDKQKMERQNSRKKTFKMRKIQFKSFIKEQQDKKIPKPVKQIHEVSYQKQDINKWGAGLNLSKMTSKFYTNPMNSRFPRDRRQQTLSKTKQILLTKKQE